MGAKCPEAYSPGGNDLGVNSPDPHCQARNLSVIIEQVKCSEHALV